MNGRIHDYNRLCLIRRNRDGYLFFKAVMIPQAKAYDIPSGSWTHEWGTDKSVRLSQRSGRTEVDMMYGFRSARSLTRGGNPCTNNT